MEKATLPQRGEFRKTERGFQVIEFLDSNGKTCELQQSSAIASVGINNPGSSFVWLGKPDSRMHLDRELVEALIRSLQGWLETGGLDT